MRFTIHYIEKGDGQRMKSGVIYDGKRRMTLIAKDEASAKRKLRSQYVKDGIKEITRIEAEDNGYHAND